jgi:phage protein U
MADGNSFVMMGLGEFRFGLNTAAYQELSRSHSWRWPTVERIGAKPATQFVGPGDDSVQMNGVIYPHFRGGLRQIEAMRAEADKGEPLNLVDGTGQVWGLYVITDIREGQSAFFSNGAPRSQTFDITLQAYGGETLESGATTPIDIAGALPSLPGSLDDFLDGLDIDLDLPTALDTSAFKAITGSASLSSLFNVSGAGIASLTSAFSMGMGVVGQVGSAVQGLTSSVRAVTGALGGLMSAPSLSALATAGVNVNLAISQANAVGGVPLDYVLGAINAAPGSASAVTALLPTTDQRAVFDALLAVNAIGGGNG